MSELLGLPNVKFEVSSNDLKSFAHEIVKEFIQISSIEKDNQRDVLFSLHELIEFLPENPARQTIYQWVSNRLIPFEKHGSRLYFRKSKIDEWLRNGRQMNHLED
ncbi:MAG: helix-turn-helix domain-containing protein [Salinivirgaceae bacterium]